VRSGFLEERGERSEWSEWSKGVSELVRTKNRR